MCNPKEPGGSGEAGPPVWGDGGMTGPQCPEGAGVWPSACREGGGSGLQLAVLREGSAGFQVQLHVLCPIQRRRHLGARDWLRDTLDSYAV